MSWLDKLEAGTPAYEIAASKSRRVRVVAGPGSGKSFAMKRRVARILEDGEDPKKILPVTFTRVGAEDLHRELVALDVPGSDRLEARTLHSLALRTLMREHVLEATGRVPRPLNEFEVKPLEADLRSYGRVRDVRRRIREYEAGWARLQHEDPGAPQSADDAAFEHALVSWLRFHRAMLIGEVIPQFYDYLRSNPAAEERREYSHILVDEYQDLNKAEQAVIDLLSDQADVCIVGDDDQSIYSFKHAHPEGIREWIEDKSEVRDLTLAECRRCPTRIVKMANSLISKNQLRPEPRELIPMEENGEGEVEIRQYRSLEREVEGVSELVTELVNNGVDPNDILILAQRSAIGTPVYERLVNNGIPVQSYYAESELNSEHAQARYALLKLFVNREDRIALRWLLGRGSSSWYSGGYKRVRDHCETTGETLWDVLQQIASSDISIPHTKPLVERFIEVRDQIQDLEKYDRLEDVIEELFTREDDSLRDLRELALKVLEEIGSVEPVKFLAELTDAIIKPEVPEEVEDVRIMSLHKSKGLSSPITIVAGCVEGLLPRQPDWNVSETEQQAQIEEQRRLFYVGITRVKSRPTKGNEGKLVLTYSQSMPIGNAKQAGIHPARSRHGRARLNASRFIGELGPYAPDPKVG